MEHYKKCIFGRTILFKELLNNLKDLNDTIRLQITALYKKQLADMPTAIGVSCKFYDPQFIRVLFGLARE